MDQGTNYLSFAGWKSIPPSSSRGTFIELSSSRTEKATPSLHLAPQTVEEPVSVKLEDRNVEEVPSELRSSLENTILNQDADLLATLVSKFYNKKSAIRPIVPIIHKLLESENKDIIMFILGQRCLSEILKQVAPQCLGNAFVWACQNDCLSQDALQWMNIPATIKVDGVPLSFYAYAFKKGYTVSLIMQALQDKDRLTFATGETPRQRTPIIEALREKNYPLSDLLLKLLPDVNVFFPFNQFEENNILLRCIWDPDITAVELVLSHGASFEARSPTGVPILFSYPFKHHLFGNNDLLKNKSFCNALVEIILQKCNINRQWYQGKLFLEQSMDPLFMEAFLEKGVDASLRNGDGLTIYESHVKEGHKELVAILRNTLPGIEHVEEDLQRVVTRRNIIELEELLERFPLEMGNTNREKYFKYVLENGTPQSIATYLKFIAGCDFDGPFQSVYFSWNDHFLRSFLETIQHGKVEAVQCVTASPVVKKLISNSLAIMGRNREWSNIFHAIFTSEYKTDFVRIVKEVVDLSIDPSSYNFMDVIFECGFYLKKDPIFTSNLEKFSKNNGIEDPKAYITQLFEDLQCLGFDINGKGGFGRTYLEAMRKEKNQGLVDFLVQLGAKD